MLCIFTIFTFTACTIGDKNNNSDHEPLSIVSMFPNIDLFIKKVNEKYPEIRFKVIPYLGSNSSAYLNAQLESGDMPDIYIKTNYAPGARDLKGKLLDLSGYNFTSNFSSALLHEVSDNGAIYLLPTYYSCIGITYNKTLLEKNGWTLPTSFDELCALAPKVKEVGCKLALDQIALPSYGFQYICNILDTGWIGNIKTVTFTGPRIKEIARMGFNRANHDVYFPYEIIGPKGLVIEDDKVYSVVITGVTDEIANEGKIIDTKILGLITAQEYFKQFKTFSKDDIKWEKIECLYRLQTQE